MASPQVAVGLVPVTCRQIASASPKTGNQIVIGHAVVKSVALVAFIVEKIEDQNHCTFSVEDATGILHNVVSYDPVQFQPLTTFQYAELHINLNMNNDSNGLVLKYLSHIRPVTDFNQVTAHLLTAYSHHLRCCLHETPLPTYRVAMQQRQAEAQATGSYGGIGTSYSAASTGINISSVQFQSGPGQSGVAQPSAIRASNPRDAVIDCLRRFNPDGNGLTVPDVAQKTQLPRNVVETQVASLMDSGEIYTSIDEMHYVAC